MTTKRHYSLQSLQNPFIAMALLWMFFAYRRFYSGYGTVLDMGILLLVGVRFTQMKSITISAWQRYLLRVACGLVISSLAVLLCMHPRVTGIFLISVLAWHCLGSGLISLIFKRSLAWYEYSLLSITAGAVLFSHVVLALGLMGYLYPVYLWAVTGGLAGLQLVIWLRSSRSKPSQRTPLFALWYRFEDWMLTQDVFCTILVLLIALFLILSIIGNFVPPTTADDLVYHLAMPKRFAMVHHIYPTPDEALTNIPYSEEMLYLQGMVLGGTYLFPGLVNLLFVGLLLAVLSMVGKRWGHPWSGVLAFLFLFSVPYFANYLYCGSVDMKHLLYCLLALYSLMEWTQTQKRPYFYLSAIMTGLAFNFRYQTVTLAAFCVLWLCFNEFQRDWKCLPWRITQFAGIVALFGFPWYVKNYVYTHNPLFPYWGGPFNGFYGDAELTQMWKALGDPHSPFIYGIFGYGTGLRSALQLPFRLTYIAGFGGYSFTPVYFALVVLLLFSRIRKLQAAILAFCLFHTAAWYFQIQELKHLIPDFAVFGLLLADRGLQLRKSWPYPFGLILSVFLIFPVLKSVQKLYFASPEIIQAKVPVLVGLKNASDYLAESLGPYRMVDYINTHLTMNDLVFSPCEIHLFYMDKPYLSGDPLHQILVDYRTFPQVEDFLARLRELKVTHLLVHEGAESLVSPVMGPPDAALMILSQKFIGPSFQTLYSVNGLRLLKINYPEALPRYDASKVLNPVLIGDVLYESGKLDAAEEQYQKAVTLGFAGGAPKLASIRAMTYLDRGDYYMTKVSQWKAYFYLRAAQLEYQAAFNSPNADKVTLQTRLDTVRITARRMVPQLWGDL